MGAGGETFILDMGDPVHIADMARDLIRLHGYEPDRDIAIQYIGLRPGEKLYEELITEGEGIVKTKHEKILVLRGNGYDWDMLQYQIDDLLEIGRAYDSVKIKLKLQEIVPEYIPEFQRFNDQKSKRGVEKNRNNSDQKVAEGISPDGKKHGVKKNKKSTFIPICEG